MTRPFTEVQIDDRKVLDALNELARRGQNLRPVMRDLAPILMSEVRDAFDTETDPVTGKKWDRLSDESTIPRREKAGHWPGSVLQVIGQLAGSMSADYGDDWAAVGTNLPYARTHQLARNGENSGPRRAASRSPGEISRLDRSSASVTTGRMRSWTSSAAI